LKYYESAQECMTVNSVPFCCW